MNTRSKAITSNTTTDMNVNSNTPHIPDEPTQEEAMPSWARAFLEIAQSIHIKLDQLENRTKNLESPDESNSWEASSSQIEIPKEPVNDHPNSSNFVPSNDHYPRDRTDYQYNQVRVDIPMFKGGDDPKEYLNLGMISSLPKTTQFTNPTPRTNSTIRCFNCQQVGHVKTNCPKLDNSEPLLDYTNEDIELENEVYVLDEAMIYDNDVIIQGKTNVCSYMFKNKKLILKPYMENSHPHKLSKVSAPLALVRKISSKKIQKSTRPTIHALIPKAIFIEHVHIIHDIVSKQLASSYEPYKTFTDFLRRYKILKQSDLVNIKIHPPKLLKIYFKFQLKNYVPFKISSKVNDKTYIMDISNDWGISNSFTISDLVKFHENEDLSYEKFSSPTPLESEDFKNSLLSPNLVSNVGLIDKIIDHQTIITDSKEDDYKFLVQWKGKPISDASWITSHDPLHYAPCLHSNFFLNMKDTSLEMKSSDPGGIDGELYQNMNTRVPSEPIYALRKRSHSQLQ